MEQGADDYLIKPSVLGNCWPASILICKCRASATSPKKPSRRNSSNSVWLWKRRKPVPSGGIRKPGNFSRWMRTSKGFSVYQRVIRWNRSRMLWPEFIREDRAAVVTAIEACKTGADFDREFRVVLPEGKIRWLYDRARPVRDEQGNVIS